MTAPLRDYQQKALEALSRDVRYLALDPGLGKTRIAIEHAKKIGARRVLVVCPNTVRLVWEAELKKWWSHAPATCVVKTAKVPSAGSCVVIINYDRLRQDYLQQLCFGSQWDLLILDEAHYLKNPDAKRTRAVYQSILPRCKAAVALSGTPMPNNAGELYTACRYLAPITIRTGEGHPMTQWQFEQTYCTHRTLRIGGNERQVIAGSKNLDDLARRIKPFMLRMKKEDVLADLPPMQFVTVPVNVGRLGECELAPYKDIIRPEMTQEEIVAALNSGDDHLMRMRAALGWAKAAPVAEYLVEFLESLPEDRKIVVWTEHQRVLDLLAIHLAEFFPVYIDGRTNAKQRQDAVNGFLTHPKCRVFIGNIKAAGTGLTLVGRDCKCSDVFFAEQSFTPSDNLQAACRVHRLGQKDGVIVRVMFASGTFDERVQAILARKSADISELEEV